MQLDDDCLRRVIPAATDLTASEIETIGQIALLTAEIDFDEEPSEERLIDALNRVMWRTIGEPVRPIRQISPLPLDREERLDWIRKLVPRLTTVHARELAFVIADLVVVIDVELSPVESALLRELHHALGITDERAEELAERGTESITPLSDDEYVQVRTMHPS